MRQRTNIEHEIGCGVFIAIALLSVVLGSCFIHSANLLADAIQALADAVGS